MIGNPYPYPIDIPDKSLLFYFYNDTSYAPEQVLAKLLSVQYNDSFYTEPDWDTVSVIKPWTGYWVKCEQDSVVLVFRNPVGRS
jgi:hypothetical protein